MSNMEQVSLISSMLFTSSNTTFFIAIGGKAFTFVSSVGGDAITLAGDSPGIVTSKFGSVYTVATGAAASITGNSANTLPSLSLQTPLIAGLATVVLSTFFGAFIIA